MDIKLNKTQRDVAIKLGIYVLIVVLAISLLTYLRGAVEESEKKSTWLRNDINELSRKLEGLNKKTLEFSEAISTWEKLSESEKTLQGLRINDAKDMLDKMQAKYKFANVRVSFSKPGDIAGDYVSDTVGVVSSTISMNFDALTDEYIFEFISDVVQNFPGYVQVKSLSMNRSTAVSKDILRKISSGEAVTIVPVTLDFYWFDLKYKGPAASAPKEGEAEE